MLADSSLCPPLRVDRHSFFTAITPLTSRIFLTRTDQSAINLRAISDELRIEKVQNNSTIKDYKGHLKSMGFDDSEIVALASIESYGNLWEPEH